MTTKNRPMVTTWKSPEIIVGRENLSILHQHLSICQNAEPGTFPSKKLNKEIGEDSRAAIGEVIDKLYDHGFIPDEALPDGTITWKILTMSDSAQEFFYGNDPGHGPALSDLEQMSRDNLVKTARAAWPGLVEHLSMNISR